MKDNRPKILPPSMRAQKRYIAFEVISEDMINYPDIVSAVWDSMLSFLGEYGTSNANIWFIHNLYNNDNQRGVLRCNHDSVEDVRTILSLIHIVGETNAIIKIWGVTGTIKSAKIK